MLPKPVTAFALSAFISIASFTASSAVAAPANVPDSASSPSSSASSPAKGAHHSKHSKKAKAKKSGQLASHAAEPKESPKAAPPKLPASMAFRVIDLKLREEDVIARINISYFRRPDNTIWGELERDKESNKKKFSPTFKLKI
jgi:hypothetical protein